MKRLFGSSRGGAPPAKDGAGPLTNKTVQVGPHTVRVEHVLGLGGYGEIYKAIDISTGEKFALKHLRLDQENIAEVQREAKTMAKLRGHPNILRLHAVAFAGPKGSETDGFFLLDYCPGTLLDLMSRHNFMLESHTVIHIFASVCQAVAAMHHQKPPLAHRDLKAENVLMLPDGTWVVCDFGSATSRTLNDFTPSAIAAEEQVIAKHTTPAYRPPEMWDLQLMRQPVDTKVDIWALGVLLFVLCFGRLPFTGESKLQIMNAKYEVPPNNTINGQTRPAQLVALIHPLLQLEPGRRPTIDELIVQLDQAALAVIGKSIIPTATPPAAAVAATPASVPAVSHQVQQQQPIQQQQQRPLQSVQQQPAEHKSPQGGTFWSTASSAAGPAPTAVTAAAAAGQQRVSTASSSSSPGSSARQQQHDWAQFDTQQPATTTTQPQQPTSSSAAGRAAAAEAADAVAAFLQQQKQTAALSTSANGAAAAAVAAAAVDKEGVGSVNASSRSGSGGSMGGLVKRAPPAPPGPSNNNNSNKQQQQQQQPHASTATQDLRVHHAVHALAPPQASSNIKGQIAHTADPAAAAAAGEAAIRQRVQAAPTAAAGAAPVGNPFASGSQPSSSSSSSAVPPLQQQQQQDPKLAQLQDIKARAAALAAARVADAPAAEPVRQQQVDDGSNSSRGGSRSRETAGVAAAAAGGGAVSGIMHERQPQPYSVSAPSSSSNSTRSSTAAGSHVVGGIISKPPAAAEEVVPALAGIPHQHGSSSNLQQRQQQQQHVAALSSPVPPPRSSSLSQPAALAADMASVLAELQHLRNEVRGLTEQNQAFVVRVKQLEEYSVQQQAAMTRLQHQVDWLQRHQQQQQQHQVQPGSKQGDDAGHGWVPQRGAGGGGADGTRTPAAMAASNGHSSAVL